MWSWVGIGDLLAFLDISEREKAHALVFHVLLSCNHLPEASEKDYESERVILVAGGLTVAVPPQRSEVPHEKGMVIIQLRLACVFDSI